MEWYSKLYIGDRAKPKAEKIIRKLKRNAGQIDIYLITLAANGQDMLDINHSAYLKLPAVRRNLPMIVGIAKGYDEAVDIVQEMLAETCAQAGNTNIPEYLKQKEGSVSKEKELQE